MLIFIYIKKGLYNYVYKIMAEYLPPSENVAIFDTLNFNDGNSPLTYNKAVKYFLRYPNAQGTENLQIVNVNGLLTANAGIKTQSIEQIAVGTTQNLFTQGTAGAKETAPLNIATGARDASAIVTINSNASSSAPTSIGGGGTSGIYFGGNANYGVGATNTLNIATNQTTGVASILTGARSYADATKTGAINFASGTATGLGANGCVLNIATGNRTIGSAINIGTGVNDSTSSINIGNGATNAGPVNIGNATNGTTIADVTFVNGTAYRGGNFNVSGGSGSTSKFGNVATTGGVTIAENQTSGALDIGGYSGRGGVINVGTGQTTGDINIGTVANRGGDINIGSGGGNMGHINIGNGNLSTGFIRIGTGTNSDTKIFIGEGSSIDGLTGISSYTTNIVGHDLLLGSNNITFGGAGPVIIDGFSLQTNIPIRPNYSGTVPTTIGSVAIGYQTTATTTTSPAAGSTTELVTLSLPSGVWSVEGQIMSPNGSSSGSKETMLCVSGGTDNSRRVYGSLGVGSQRLNSIFTLASTTTIAVRLYTSVLITNAEAYIRATRIA